MILSSRFSKFSFIIFSTFALCSCVTSNVINEGDLPNNLRQIAIEMRLRAENQCMTYSYDPSTGDKLSGNVKIASKVMLRKIYTSDSNWFRAEIIGNGVIDDVFYLPSTGRFVCGQRTWHTFPDEKNIIFREYASSINAANLLQQSRAPLSTSSTTSSSNIRSIAVSWDGYSRLIAGSIDLSPDGHKPGFFTITLPNNDGQCSGQTKQSDRRTGVWSISCTNGMNAAGTFEAYGDGKGASGIGTDSKGKEVRYTISGVN
jgi:hypothetical protein